MHILITAGPTREWIDPVRFISNPSSGKMGYALARAARETGARVTLVSGPVSLRPPTGVEVVQVETAAEMACETLARSGAADVVVCAAAVADWTPEKIAAQKIKKNPKSEIRNPKLVLRLKPTLDIAHELGLRKRSGQILVGFAAETEHVEAHAREKLVRKNLDFIVANDVSKAGAGFAVDTNEIVLIDAQGGIDRPPRASKLMLARRIFRKATALWSARRLKLKRSTRNY